MKLKTFSGYSGDKYNAIFGGKTPRVLLGDEGLEKRLKFDPKTNVPLSTGEVESTRLWVYYPELGIQSIKLPADYSLSKDVQDLAEVELVAPEACVVGRDVYVRANAVKLR